MATEQVEVTFYRAEWDKDAQPLPGWSWISTWDEALRDRWVKSLRKQMGKDVEIRLSQETKMITRTVVEEKTNKEESS